MRGNGHNQHDASQDERASSRSVPVRSTELAGLHRGDKRSAAERALAFSWSTFLRSNRRQKAFDRGEGQQPKGCAARPRLRPTGATGARRPPERGGGERPPLGWPGQASSLQLAHFFGKCPQSAIELHTLVDALDRASPAAVA